MRPWTLAIVALVGCAHPSATRPAAPADLVLAGGDVITMDPARPHARAVAIAGDRIVAVGDDLRAWIGPQTRVIDLAGRTVTPGLVDGHCHLGGLGIALDEVDLRDAASEADAVRAVTAGAHPGDDWVTGRGWDQNLWGGGFPTHASLDAAFPTRPVVLERIDGHATWVNGAALAIAGITRDTPDPAGGRILRDAHGEPTGVLVDNAMDLVEAHHPAPDDATIERRIRAAAAYAAARGITGVHEMGIDDATVAVYRRIAGTLPLRVTAYATDTPALSAKFATPPTDLDDGFAWFSLRGVKLFADGALGSRGAALFADYSDDPGNRGNWVTSPDDLKKATVAAVDGGWQVATHAIGDAGVHAVLDAYAAAEAAHPHADLRLRVEHAQVVAPDDIARFAQLHVLASMQPSHATSDMPWAEARLGPSRIQGAYAWRTLMNAGATIVGGSDFPVEEVGPLLQIYAAVTRQDAAGKPAGGWYPGERMTLDEALAAYTVAPAYAAFVEAHRGRVREGMAADLTVIAVPGGGGLRADHSLLDATIAMTIVGGKVMFDEGAKRP